MQKRPVFIGWILSPFTIVKPARGKWSNLEILSKIKNQQLRGLLKKPGPVGSFCVPTIVDGPPGSAESKTLIKPGVKYESFQACGSP